MKTWLVDNQSASTEPLAKLLTDLGYKPDVVPFSELYTLKIKPDDLIVLSGSGEYTASWNNDTFADEIEIIKSHKGPLIGVCFGMQLMAHAYGAHLHQLTEKRYGLAPITAVNPGAPFTNDEYPVVFEGHSWSVKKLHSPLVSLAESGSGVEILRHKTLPHYGVQFHPEATDPGNGKQIFQRILGKVISA